MNTIGRIDTVFQLKGLEIWTIDGGDQWTVNNGCLRYIQWVVEIPSCHLLH